MVGTAAGSLSYRVRWLVGREAGRMLRHVPVWARWVVVALISYCMGAALDGGDSARTLAADGNVTALGRCAVVLIMTAPIELLIALIVGLASIGDKKRRKAQAELAAREQTLNSLGVAEGARLFATLLTGGSLPPRKVWGLVLEPGEQVHLDLEAFYSRFYGQDVTYRTGGGVYFGPPAVVLAGLLAGAAADRAAAARARAAAAPRWREHQVSRVLLTTQRLVCMVNGSWMSFYYRHVTALYPDLVQSRSVTLEFGDACVPLRLEGMHVPTISTYLCWALHNGVEGLRHPALSPVRDYATDIVNHLSRPPLER